MINTAVIGAGRMGLSTKDREHLVPVWYKAMGHAESIALHPELRLTGICDCVEAQLTQAKKLFPSAHLYQDARVLLEKEKPDLVCIATRTPVKCELIELCAKYGVKGIHVEKPLCRSMSELERISKCIEHGRIHLTMGAVRRYIEPYLIARDMLGLPEVGRVKQISIGMGDAQLGWCYSHALDLVNFYMEGEDMNGVTAYGKEYRKDANAPWLLDGDPFIDLIRITTTTGMQAIITRGESFDTEICCENAIISIKNDGMSVTIRRRSTISQYFSEESLISLGTPKWTGTLAALNRHIAAGNQAERDSENVLFSQRLLLACVQSLLRDSATINPRNIHEHLTITMQNGTQVS